MSDKEFLPHGGECGVYLAACFFEFFLHLLFDPEDCGDIFLRNFELSDIHGVTIQKTVKGKVKLLLVGWD
jgi:hypothetical protein